MQYWSIKLCCYPLGNTVWNAGLISVLNFLYRNLRSRIQRLILFSSPSLSKYHSSRIEQICNTVPQTTCTYTTLYCICTLITGTAWQEAGSLRQVHKRGEGRNRKPNWTDSWEGKKFALHLNCSAIPPTMVCGLRCAIFPDRAVLSRKLALLKCALRPALIREIRIRWSCQGTGNWATRGESFSNQRALNE